MNKKAKFLFFCMIFVAAQNFAQNMPVKITPFITRSFVYNAVPVRLLPQNKFSGAIIYSPLLSANYYASHLGFFCKEEIKFEKIVKIPIKFRLGGVEDCDKLEGKKNWRN